MLILGIETSCDETAVALLEAKGAKQKFKLKKRASVVSSQVKIHAPYGGVVPILANREHLKNLGPVFLKCLKEAKIKLEDARKEINLIAVTEEPGLTPALLMGINFGRTLAWLWQKPLINVNHLLGHLYSFLLSQNWLKKQKNGFNFNSASLKYFPAICLLVSGGHTQLIYLKNLGHYQIIGETRDDAAGECFDKTARLMGLGYPGGPAIAAEAEKLKIKNLKLKINIRLPRPMIYSQNYDFSFSGLKTAVLYLLKDLKKQKNWAKLKPQLAFEIQQAIVDVLVYKTIKASRDLKAKSIMISGGVSANQKLRADLEKAGSKQHLYFFAPDLDLTTDNALMIAGAGFLEYLGIIKNSSF